MTCGSTYSHMLVTEDGKTPADPWSWPPTIFDYDEWYIGHGYLEDLDFSYRVSRSGEATPQPGDLEGRSDVAVAPGPAVTVGVEIAQVRP